MLQLKNLTKWYPSPHGRKYVFRDLSVSLPEDANIGLIGRNGAGKSTLMNLIGGIDTPNAGSVLTDRRISWPVGLRGGFQPTLSGRENVQFVCRVYGATGKAMREKLDFVEQFAEIGDFFDLPMRSYSSGMRSRVAFGLSMAFDFNYYLFDEVMAVGDAVFKRKSHQVLSERLKSSNLILVSHSMTPIRAYCNVVVLVDHGQVSVFDDVEAGIAAYQRIAEDDDTPETPIQALRTARRERREVRQKRREERAATAEAAAALPKADAPATQPDPSPTTRSRPRRKAHGTTILIAPVPTPSERRAARERRAAAAKAKAASTGES